VFCIIMNTVPNVLTTANYSFTLDGAVQPSYSHAPDPNSNTPLYNVSVLSVTGLENIPHTFVMTLVPPSFALFDHAVYT
jgi:hypothetical protein